MKSIDSTLAPHVRGIQQRYQRMQVLAGNIANADTPHYKARDLAFGDTLRDARAGAARADAGMRLKTTDSRHLATGGGALESRLLYRVPEQASLDGNTVDKDLEQSRFAENAMRYQASVQFFGGRVKSLLRVLKGE